MNNILDKFRLDGKTAVVTGGAGLLGREFCTALAQAGAKVVAADLVEETAGAVADGIVKTGRKAMGVGVDVTSEASVRTMVERTVSAFGSLDVLVCSAAMDPKFDPNHAEKQNNAFENYPVDMWRQAVDVNLTGLFLCAREASVQMLKQKSGVIINICSTYGLVGPDQRIYEKPGQPPQYKPVYYSVTKAGVLGLTRYLATYFGDERPASAISPPKRRMFSQRAAAVISSPSAFRPASVRGRKGAEYGSRRKVSSASISPRPFPARRLPAEAM
jgi:2-deoxy-D-gluconate 3-dehydrogenase